MTDITTAIDIHKIIMIFSSYNQFREGAKRLIFDYAKTKSRLILFCENTHIAIILFLH